MNYGIQIIKKIAHSYSQEEFFTKFFYFFAEQFFTNLSIEVTMVGITPTRRRHPYGYFVFA